jgi:hypothetical protein
MEKIVRHVKKPNFYLPLILLFIFGDTVCDNYMFKTFNHETHVLEFFLFLGALTLQILASPIQAALSDLYCRKKSLIVSLFFSLIALVFVYLYGQRVLFYFPILLLIIFFKGALGNTIPLSLAAIADTQEKNVRFSFGLSTSSYAIAYLLLIFSNKFLTEKQSGIVSIVLFAMLVFLCAKLFKDTRDKNKTPSHAFKFITALGLVVKEMKLIAADLKRKHIRNALISFLLWEISLYSIVLLYVDFNVAVFSNIAIAMQCGYLVGAFLLKFCDRIDDRKMIKIGYNFSALSLVPFFILSPFYENFNFLLLAGCYFFHTMGNALLGATLFAIISKETSLHQQGKIYGLIESTDTIAFLIASVSVMIYNFFHLHLLFIILLSYLTVMVSWLPYARFDKTRPGELQE